MRHILHQDWVPTWSGWHDACIALTGVDSGVDEEVQQEAIAAECLHRFCRISLANVSVPEKSDAAREAELQAAGKVIGDGELHGENDCCADSLLQLLAAHRFVPTALLGNAGKKMRKVLCLQCRQHLVEHTNERLHPQILDAAGGRADAYQAEHNRAHLQHDLHAEAIVRFFLIEANKV